MAADDSIRGGEALTVFHMSAKVFDDGMFGVKAKTDLVPGDYEAVVVLRRVATAIREHASSGEAADAPLEPMDQFLERVRREHLQAALERADGNRTHAAKLLGVDVRTVFRLLDKKEDG